MENKISTRTLDNYYLGDRLLILSAANEVAFLKNGEISHRQKLEPRIMAVLKILLEGDGQVVLREKLISSIWGDYPGGEEGLIQAISKLRRIFRDSAKSPKVIETIPKKGYRLLLKVAPVNFRFTTEKNGRIPDRRGTSAPPVIVQQVGLFTGFLERLTQPRFLLAFLVFSAVLIMVLGILSYMLFWGAVAMDKI